MHAIGRVHDDAAGFHRFFFAILRIDSISCQRNIKFIAVSIIVQLPTGRKGSGRGSFCAVFHN